MKYTIVKCVGWPIYKRFKLACQIPFIESYIGLFLNKTL
jgi:hypothetical protein